MISQPAKGTRDILPGDLARRRRVLKVIRGELVLRGFQEIETPAIESIENLTSKQGGDNESMLFEILRRGLNHQEPIEPAKAVDLGLRYDLTLPLSRYYAHNHAALPSVFRAFQTGSVWRAERPQKGRFRQFQQCDIDIIGDDTLAPEIEVLTCGWSVLRKLHVEDKCTVLINDRRLLDWLMQAVGVDVQRRSSVLISLDKLDKIGLDRVMAEMTQLAGLDELSAQKLMSAMQELSKLDLMQLSEDQVQIEAFEEPVPLWNLRTIMRQVYLLTGDVRICFAPTLVRGMGYYTGVIFEVKHEESGSSVCGGGRYDKMIGNMLGKPVPSVGFSFGFERLIDLVTVENTEFESSIALAYTNTEQYVQALGLRERLLAQDRRVGLVQAPSKPKRAFFDRLTEEGYDAVLMPDELLSSPEEVEGKAKPLNHTAKS